MYFSDMSDPPMAASSKASVASEATCTNQCGPGSIITVSQHVHIISFLLFCKAMVYIQFARLVIPLLTY